MAHLLRHPEHRRDLAHAARKAFREPALGEAVSRPWEPVYLCPVARAAFSRMRRYPSWSILSSPSRAMIPDKSE